MLPFDCPDPCYRFWMSQRTSDLDTTLMHTQLRFSKPSNFSNPFIHSWLMLDGCAECMRKVDIVIQ